MRRSLLLFFLLAVPAILAGATVEVSWNANTEPDLAGYTVYKSSDGSVWTFVGTTQATLYDIDNVSDGMWYFAVTAFDTAGNESAKSTPVSLTVNTQPPVPPSGIKAIIKK